MLSSQISSAEFSFDSFFPLYQEDEIPHLTELYSEPIDIDLEVLQVIQSDEKQIDKIPQIIPLGMRNSKKHYKLNVKQKIEIIEEWRKSGLSMIQYSKIKGLPARTFSYWRTHYDKSYQKTEIVSRRRFSNSEKQQILSEWYISDLPLEDFCQFKNISSSSLRRWRAKKYL